MLIRLSQAFIPSCINFSTILRPFCRFAPLSFDLRIWAEIFAYCCSLKRNFLLFLGGQVIAMFYGAMVWDPWLIVSQIVCIQALNYLSLGVLLWLLVGTHVPRFSLNYFFDYSTLTTSTFTGWLTIVGFLLNALAGAGYLLFVVERAKKCLDFAATMYIIHLFLCLLYGGLPSSITWWVVNGIGVVVMALLGEWLCIRRELREIPMRSTRASV